MKTIKKALIATASRAEDNSEAIEGLITSQRTTQISLDRLTVQVDQLTVDIDQMRQTIQAAIDQLVIFVVRSIESTNADRAVMREMQTDIRGLRTENRQILETLSEQRQ